MSVEAAAGRRLPLAVRLAAVIAASLAIWLAMAWMADNLIAAWPQNLTHTANAAFVFACSVPMVVAARRHLERRSWAGLRVTGLGEGWRPFVVGVVS